MKDIKKIINKQRYLFKSNSLHVEARRNNWSLFSTRAKEIFQQVINEFQQQPFFDSLYINEINSPKLENIERRNQNAITLRFGHHSTGIGTFEYSRDGNIKSGNVEIETGGALHYSQSPNGQIVCLIYGSKSELIKPKDEWFVFKRYDNPYDITEKEILKAIKVFFWYSRITSFIRGLSIIDTFKLDFYKLRSFTTKPDWNAIFGVIGAISAIISIIAFIISCVK